MHLNPDLNKIIDILEIESNNFDKTIDRQMKNAATTMLQQSTKVVGRIYSSYGCGEYRLPVALENVLPSNYLS